MLHHRLLLLAALLASAAPAQAAEPAAGAAIVNVSSSVLIRRPADEVFAFVSDVENDIKWRGGIVSIRRTTPGPIGAGTRSAEVLSVMGRTLETENEVHEFVAGQRMASRTIKGPTPVQVVRTVEAAPGGAVFRYQLRSDVSGVFLFRAARPLLQWWYQRKTDAYLEDLRKLMEEGGRVGTR